MCIRAFDYLPPVDITFGDYLRALVTADFELVPVDELQQRMAVVDAFRLRGVYPDGVLSLAEESVLWTPSGRGDLPPFPVSLLGDLAISDVRLSRAQPRRNDFSLWRGGSEGASPVLNKRVARQAHTYATANAARLGLDPTRPIAVHGFRSVLRVASNGQLLVELVAMFVQTDESKATELGGIPLRGGTTVIAAEDGTVRYVIAKPLGSKRLSAEFQRDANRRLERQRQFVADSDLRDPNMAWKGRNYVADRMRRRAKFSSIHGGVVI
jgi:hypothetical protein